MTHCRKAARRPFLDEPEDRAIRRPRRDLHFLGRPLRRTFDGLRFLWARGAISTDLGANIETRPIRHPLAPNPPHNEPRRTGIDDGRGLLGFGLLRGQSQRHHDSTSGHDWSNEM
jgi:hypothetical protein